jgi:hypothetical protein
VLTYCVAYLHRHPRECDDLTLSDIAEIMVCEERILERVKAL